MALNGKHVVVTGAAQGIGECVARTLSGRGAVLYLTDIQEEKVAGVADGLGGPERARRHLPIRRPRTR